MRSNAIQKLDQFTANNQHKILSRILTIRNHPIVIDNFPMVAIVAIYILLISSVHSFLRIQGRIILNVYYDLFARVSVFFIGAFFVFHILKGTVRRYLTPGAITGFLIVFFIAPLFVSSFASYKQTIPLVHDFSWDRTFMHWDYVLHFGHHPWRLLEPLLHQPRIFRAIDLLYSLWFLVLFIFCLWMGWSQRRRLRFCFFVSTLLIWILLGSGLGTVFSSAGPCYYSNVETVADDPYAPLMSSLNELHKNEPLAAINNQIGLWQAKLKGVWLPFGGISAMPSIHLAMATVFALFAFRVRRWLGVIFTCYVVLIQIGSVILAWHYAIDGYAGIVLACLIWFAVTRFSKGWYGIAAQDES